MTGYDPGHYKGWDDVPDVEGQDICAACDGEGVVWTHEIDPQDDVELPCQECRPEAFECWRCHDTGYTRNAWTRRKEPCPACWQEPPDKDEPLTDRETVTP